MPEFFNRHKGNHVKVYRPTGTLYAEARCDDQELGAALVYSLMAGLEGFRSEHGHMPAPERVNIEIRCDGSSAACTVYELPEVTSDRTPEDEQQTQE